MNALLKLPKNAHIWLPGYVKSRLRVRQPARRVWVAVTDHYEPFWRNTDERIARERVARWVREWPRIAGEYTDSAGRPPVYTFFYAEEEYRADILDELAALAGKGIGDVEVHLHHDGEGEQDFVDRISGFVETLTRRHGLLRQAGGRPVFGFIHGNWALDNANPDGSKCGLNNELTLLERLGCYADFTLPSIPHPGQSRLVNTIYWAVDDPERPKSYDSGLPVEAMPDPPAGALLMIPGPLGVRSRLWGRGNRIAPRIERGELSGGDPATRERVRLWLEVAPQIGSDVFIKLYTHGAQERNSDPLLSNGLRDTFRLLLEETRARGEQLYFASAWQMRQAIDALGRGADPIGAACTPAVHSGARS